MGASIPLSKALQNLAQDPDSFSAQYRDQRWKNRAREFRSQLGNFCQSCKQSGKETHVHHLNYSPGAKLWEAENEDLCLLCKSCHESIHDTIRLFRRTAGRCNASNIAAITRVVSTLIRHLGDKETLRLFATKLQ